MKYDPCFNLSPQMIERLSGFGLFWLRQCLERILNTGMAASILRRLRHPQHDSCQGQKDGIEAGMLLSPCIWEHIYHDIYLKGIRSVSIDDNRASSQSTICSIAL